MYNESFLWFFLELTRRLCLEICQLSCLGNCRVVFFSFFGALQGTLQSDRQGSWACDLVRHFSWIFLPKYHWLEPLFLHCHKIRRKPPFSHFCSLFAHATLSLCNSLRYIQRFRFWLFSGCTSVWSSGKLSWWPCSPLSINFLAKVSLACAAVSSLS